MIDGRRVLGVIPARGGSKGIPRKNVREVGGKPLIAWTIEEARKSRHIDRLILSSDEPEIIEVAKRWGCEVPFIRPADLARDETPGVQPALHAIEAVPGFDVVVLLQPTSPLRRAEDIDGCISLLASAPARSCVSVTLAEESPYWMFTLADGGRLLPVLPSAESRDRRQDLPAAYVLNGAVYVAECGWLRQNGTFLAGETLGYVMPRARSLDIDTEFDLKILELSYGEVRHGDNQEAG